MDTRNLPEEPPSAAETARLEAQDVGNAGLDAGHHVASVTKDEVRNVAQQAEAQAQDLIAEFTSSVRAQVEDQQQRVADGLRSISAELQSMAESRPEQAGTASHWVQAAARKANDAAGWLDQREPGTLLEEVKGFARRRPGAFLGIAMGAGVLAGRLTRGLGEDAAEDSSTPTAPPKTPPDQPLPQKLPPTPDYVLTSDAGTGVSAATEPWPLPGDETGEPYVASDVPGGLEPPPGFPPAAGGAAGAGGRLP